jgi:hypothetical protein
MVAPPMSDRGVPHAVVIAHESSVLPPGYFVAVVRSLIAAGVRVDVLQVAGAAEDDPSSRSADPDRLRGVLASLARSTEAGSCRLLPRTGREALSALVRLRPDIVVLPWSGGPPRAGTVGILRAARLAGAAVLLDLAGLPTPDGRPDGRPDGVAGARRARVLVRSSTRLVVHTRDAHAFAVQVLGADPARLAPTTAGDHPADASSGDAPCRLLYVGHDAGWPGFDVLLRAFDAVAASDAGRFRLTALGSLDAMDRDLAEVLASARHRDHIFVLDPGDDHAPLAAAVNACDVLVVSPDRTDSDTDGDTGSDTCGDAPVRRAIVMALEANRSIVMAAGDPRRALVAGYDHVVTPPGSSPSALLLAIDQAGALAPSGDRAWPAVAAGVTDVARQFLTVGAAPRVRT